MSDVKTLVGEVNKLKDEDKTQFLTEFLSEQKVLWLANAIKALEDKFGVKAQAAVAAMPAGGAGAGGAAPAAAAKTTFDVILKGLKDPNARLNVIKAVREITKLGLQEAKALVDGAPKPVKEAATKEESDKIKKDLETAGGDVELK
jgi:large subunit ribosomal protein L7/L12